jgi:hypothetical protein
MPAINKRILTSVQARPVPIKIRPYNATLRHSQQLFQIAAKHPKTELLLRLGKAIHNFKESPIPIIDHKPESPILISQRKHDCHTIRHDAIHSRHTHSQPASQPMTHSPHYQAARSGSLYTTLHAHGYSVTLVYSTARRHGTAWEQGISYL